MTAVHGLVSEKHSEDGSSNDCNYVRINIQKITKNSTQYIIAIHIILSSSCFLF